MLSKGILLQSDCSHWEVLKCGLHSALLPQAVVSCVMSTLGSLPHHSSSGRREENFSMRFLISYMNFKFVLNS